MRQRPLLRARTWPNLTCRKQPSPWHRWCSRWSSKCLPRPAAWVARAGLVAGLEDRVGKVDRGVPAADPVLVRGAGRVDPADLGADLEGRAAVEIWRWRR